MIKLDNKTINYGKISETRLGLFILLFFAVLLVFNDLSEPGLPSNDDCAKSRRAVEMLESGNVLTPTLGGEPDFDHPPLYIGMLALCIMLLGNTAFAVRFLGGLSAILSIFLTYQTARDIQDRKAGWWAGFFLTTSYLFLKIARRVQSDIPFMAFSTLALFLFVRAFKAYEESRKNDFLRYMLLFAVASGLAGMIKSVFFVFPLGAPFLFILFTKRLKKDLFITYVISGLISSIMFGWWYVYSYIKHGDVFVEKFISGFIGHHAAGTSRMGKFGYFGYIYEITRHFWPWLPLLLFAFWLIYKHKKFRKSPYIQFLSVYALTPLIVLSFVGDKAARYVIFIFVPFVILISMTVMEKLKLSESRKYTVFALIFLTAVSSYVIIRPVKLKNIPNKPYVVLRDRIERGELKINDELPWYFHGMYYKRNMRGLIYYTGKFMKKRINGLHGIKTRLRKGEKFYVLMEKDDYKYGLEKWPAEFIYEHVVILKFTDKRAIRELRFTKNRKSNQER